MKRLSKILIIFLTIALTLSLSSCIIDILTPDPLILDTPDVTVAEDGSHISWEEIPHSVYYLVKIGDIEVIVRDETSYYFEMGGNDVIVSVQAIGDGIVYSDSEAASLTADIRIMLSAPLITYQRVIDTLNISWEAVDDSVGYLVDINGVDMPELSSATLTYDYTMPDYGTYIVGITAIAPDIGYYLDSERSEITYIYTEPVPASLHTGEDNQKTYNKANSTDVLFLIDINDDTTYLLTGHGITSSDYTYDGTTLIIDYEYLYLLDIDTYTFVFTTEGAVINLEIEITDSRTPQLLSTGATYNVANPSDVAIPYSAAGSVFSSVLWEGSLMASPTEYEHVTGYVTLKSAYLAIQAVGDYTITVLFSAGTTTYQREFTLEIVNTLKPLSLDTSLVFDRVSPDDLVFNLSLNGEALVGVQGLLESSDWVYSSTSETFTVKEEYLDTLPVGEYDIMLYTGINAFPVTVVVVNSGNKCYNVHIDTDSASPSVLLKWDYDGSDVDFYYRIDGGSQVHVIGTHQAVLSGKSGDDSFDYEVKPLSGVYDTIYSWDPDSAGASAFASTYTFMGETHDYYLASQEELNNYIYYICFSDRTGAVTSPEHPYGYKQMTTPVYIDFDFGGSLFESGGELSTALESMPIKGYSVSCIDISSPGSLTFTVIYSTTASLYSTPNTFISSQKSWFPSHVESGDYDIRGTARGASYNAFAIESILKTQTVSTSDQLYAAVLNGVRPICETSSIAADIYEEAKDVLRDIITDDMDEFEKVHAIYDWLIFNVEYDLDMLDQLVYLQSLYPIYSEYYAEVSKYRCFYLEGVFLDGLAVCDGFAKAFVLLARIEGIEAIKISGTVISSGESHAWNKVHIDDNWYTVDSTWGNYLVHNTSPDSYYEYMNHAYLLISDAEMFASHRESGPYPASGESYGYYQSIYEAPGVDYYIEDQADFNELMDEIFSSGYPSSDVYAEIFNASGLGFDSLFTSARISGHIPLGFLINTPSRNVYYFEIREGAEGTAGDHIVLIQFDS